MNFSAYEKLASSRNWSEEDHVILIVDDESRIRTSLRKLLDQKNREILECGTGAETINMMKSRDIDLVLLDINLPDCSGLNVLEWIKKFQNPASVIMVSADTNIESAIKALRHGAAEFVRKPHELEGICHKVDNELYRRSLERCNRQMFLSLEQSEHLHRFLVENSPDLIYTLDQTGRFMYINGRIESILGYKSEELIGKHYTTIVHEEDREKATFAFNERRRDSRATSNLEIRLKCNESSDHRKFESRHVVAILSSSGIYSKNGDHIAQESQRYVGTYGVARDITERKLAEETISYQAMHDHLTNLPNRMLFKNHLELAINHSKRTGSPLAVFFIDLDRFKLINDTYGHAEGDELLKNVADRLRHCIRAGDTLARQGGDEFTVLLPDLIKPEDSIRVANKMLEELRFPFSVAGHDFLSTASIGISLYPHDGDNAELLIRNSDIAMYKVKANGKNGYQFFTPLMKATHDERITLEKDLRLAVQNSEFELYFQPQINVSNNRIVGMEALLRWRHPVHGILGPSTFLELAEETGLISSITDWVLSESCKHLSRWRKKGLHDIRVAVNFSPTEFERTDIVERILSTLTSHNLPPSALEVEITENLLLRDVSGVIDILRLLREVGVQVSIDDFGTCYSSLNYLRNFPVSAIKIDQSFIRDLTEDKSSSPIIPAIIDIARGFDLHLIAEGVETSYQKKTLISLGCESMQGFFFSRPMPLTEVDDLLTKYQKSGATTFTRQMKPKMTLIKNGPDPALASLPVVGNA